MKLYKLLIVLVMGGFSSYLYAYGGGGGSATKSCKKPVFSDFKPAHLATVPANSEFSFQVSSKTNPDSISVIVKKKPVAVSVKQISTGYVVIGKLPTELQQTYARIDIKASTIRKCDGADGWLVKID